MRPTSFLQSSKPILLRSSSRKSRGDESKNPDSEIPSVSLAPDRRRVGGTKKPSRLLLLKKRDCPAQWEAVSKCLRNVKDLQLQDGNTIRATSKLDEAEDLDAVTKAIAILVDAGNLVPACALMGMCKPSALIVLLEPCTLAQINELKVSKDPAVRKAMDLPLRAAGRRAWKDGDFLRCRKLVQCCSPEVKASFIRRSLSIVKEMTHFPMDDDMPALRAALAWVPELDLHDRLTLLSDLLTITNNLRAHELARSVAMKCIIWPALGQVDMPIGKLEAMAWFPELTPELLDAVPASMRSEVLRIAVEQAANSPKIKECTNRLLGLASLSGKIVEPLGEELKSHIKSALIQLPQQWDEEIYESHKHLLLKVENKVQRGRQAGIIDTLKAKAERVFGIDSAGTLVQLVMDFRLAIRDGNLRTAALMIHDSSYPEFGETAREELLNAVVHKFAEVGLKLQHWPFSLGEAEQENPELAANQKIALAAQQDSVVLEMAAALIVSGGPYCPTLAARILSEHFATQQRQEAAIQRLIDGLGIGLRAVISVDILNGDLVYALPELCSADHAAELDVILAMEEGRSLVAIAVVDCLLQDDCSDATIALLFKTLAHRIDLRAALPSILTGVQLKDERIVKIPMDLPQFKMSKVLQRLRVAQLASAYAKDCDRWVSGWRLLAYMHQQPELFSHDTTALLAIQAIDAAAADGLHGGANELLDKMFDSTVDAVMRAMLEPPVTGTHLLSGKALVNVMRAFVSDGRLALSALKWKLYGKEAAMLHMALAHALISLMDDVTPCRFDPTRPANHAVASVADAFMKSLDLNPALAFNPALALNLKKEIGEEALERIEKASLS